MHSVFDHHERGTLLFSAGKDSLACLLKLKPHWDQISVAWANPGAPTDEVVQYMAGIAKRVPHFIEVKGNQPQWIAQYGWPLDVVPVRSTLEPHGSATPETLFVPYTACCSANMWLPIKDHVKQSGSTLIITGQRRTESLRNRLRDEEVQEIDGLTYWNCINDWSDQQVFDYLKSHNEPLPPGYGDGDTSSADCWNCTAYLDHNKNRIQRMKSREPEKWQVVNRVLKAADHAIWEQSSSLEQLL